MAYESYALEQFFVVQVVSLKDFRRIITCLLPAGFAGKTWQVDPRIKRYERAQDPLSETLLLKRKQEHTQKGLIV